MNFEAWCGMDGACGWGMVRHTLERALLHVASGGSVALLAMATWHACASRGWLWILRGKSFYALPALIAVFAISLREPWDVANGDPALKSTFDWLSWVMGIGLAQYALWRLTDRLMEVRLSIQTQRQSQRARREAGRGR